MMEKIPFLISPPYQVPPITVIRSAMWKAPKTSERRPYLAKSWQDVLQAFRIVQSGLKFFNSSAVGRINMFLKKCAIQATSVTNRTLIRVCRFVPQKPSMTYNFFPFSCLTEISLRCCQASAERCLLSEPAQASSAHHTLVREVGSSTIYLSLGERPVNLPVSTATVPEVVTVPRSYPSNAGSVSCLKSSS